ncbi:MAG: hypothetical protein AAF557_26115, partial [Pseudomonadota bacterium]
EAVFAHTGDISQPAYRVGGSLRPDKIHWRNLVDFLSSTSEKSQENRFRRHNLVTVPLGSFNDVSINQWLTFPRLRLFGSDMART